MSMTTGMKIDNSWLSLGLMTDPMTMKMSETKMAESQTIQSLMFAVEPQSRSAWRAATSKNRQCAGSR
jgi:hypothetical protein